MDINFEQFDGTIPLHIEAVKDLEEWSSQELIRPINFTRLQAYPYSLLAFSPEGKSVGHIAVTSCHDRTAVVGGLIVNPECRQRGIGQALVVHLLAQLGNVMPDVKDLCAYSNYRSLRLFERAGGKFIGHRIPTERGGYNYIVSLNRAITRLQQ